MGYTDIRILLRDADKQQYLLCTSTSLQNLCLKITFLLNMLPLLFGPFHLIFRLNLCQESFEFFEDFWVSTSPVSILFLPHQRMLIRLCYKYQGLFTWRKEVPSARNILEGGSSQYHMFSVFSLHAKRCTCLQGQDLPS